MDATEECLLTVHAREWEWALGSGPLERNVCRLYIHYCESSNSQYIFATTYGPYQKLFFHLQKSEDQRRARLDDKYRE